MNQIEPLIDLEARILCVSPNTQTAVVIDRLLRLQSGRNWRSPIWLYLPGADGAMPEARSLAAMDFLTLHSVLRSLKSPVHGVALGLLRSFEPLLLASCKVGHRYMLPSAMCCVGALPVDGLPFSRDIGLNSDPGTSLREQAGNLIRAQLDHVLAQLELPAAMWQAQPNVLSAPTCIDARIADQIVPIADLSRTIEQAHEIEP